MARTRKQIDDDARAAAANVHASRRAHRITEVAEALRSRGISQTDKQARITVARAEELGLLRRRGRSLWESAAGGARLQEPPEPEVGPAPAQVAIYCASRLLEMPPSAAVLRKARSLLWEALQQLPPLEGVAVSSRCEESGLAALWEERPGAAGPSNGGGDGGPSTLEVLLAADS